MLPLLISVFMDSLGFGLVFPIFSPLIINNAGGMFDDGVSLAVRGLIFGLLVSVYCFAQFFGGPVLGSLSDRIGRKRVLIGAKGLAVVGFSVAAYGILLESIVLLFLARIFCGVAAGGFPVAQSFIADQSTKENKAKRMGLVGMSFWTGFVLGPFFGGKLAMFGFVVPFASAAALCFFTLILLMLVIKEEAKEPVKEKLRLFAPIAQIKRAFSIVELRGLFAVMFVFSLGWGFFTEFSPIFLLKRFSFGVGQIADFYAWVGLWVALSQGLLIRPVLKRFSPEKLLPTGLLALGVILPFILLLSSPMKLFFIVPVIGLSVAMIFPTAATIVSNLSQPEKQGEYLGMHNSVQWLAIAIPPLCSGSLAALYPHVPISVGSVCVLIAFVVFLRVFRPKKLQE